MSLLAGFVPWMSPALRFPDSAVLAVVEHWGGVNFNPLPSESSSRATTVPVLAMSVLSLFWADGSVIATDNVVVDWLDDDDPVPSESSP